MGLLLSVLVGCVGVYELLACLGRASNRATILRIDPPTACLSYHDRPQGGFTGHDSLCGIGHSEDLRLPRGARYKLENLHEYSLKIRSELRSLGKNIDGGTLSECSTGDILGEIDIKFDLDLETLEDVDVGESSASFAKDRPVGTFERVPTPIPSSYNLEIDRQSGLDSSNESLNVPSVIERYKDSASSGDESDDDEDDNGSVVARPVPRTKSKSPEYLKTTNYKVKESLEVDKGDQRQTQTKKSKNLGKYSTTIVRKSTRLKSKNTEISKSAENLSGRRSKRNREPERRKSEISIRSTSDLFRDEWTNTSPPGSPSLSRSESRKSVDAEVQTCFDEEPFEEEKDYPVFGLSESKRDLASRDRRAKKVAGT